MKAILKNKKSVTARDTLYTFYCPELARRAMPGQFVEILLSENLDPFLRMPISIFDCDKKETITLLLRTVGKGTESMTKLQPEKVLDISGPFGNGFNLTNTGDTCVLACGGIGLAPLNWVAKELLSEGKKVRLFFSPMRDFGITDSIDRETWAKIEVLTAENRQDIPGKFTYALNSASSVLACGPEGMLETIAGMCNEKEIPCQLSMEALMGCGFGICVGCNIAVYTDEGLTYKRVCVDGPVFSSKEVSFHERP